MTPKLSSVSSVSRKLLLEYRNYIGYKASDLIDERFSNFLRFTISIFNFI